VGAPNAARIETPEGAYAFRSTRLSEMLKEIDAYVNGANVWVTFTRVSGLISKVEYFSNSARTIKILEASFTRGAGIGGVLLVTQIAKTYFNLDTSTDATITEAISRPALGTDDVIGTCDSPFSTTETTDP
jgi:hypothetical protein